MRALIGCRSASARVSLGRTDLDEVVPWGTPRSRAEDPDSCVPHPSVTQIRHSHLLCRRLLGSSSADNPLRLQDHAHWYAVQPNAAATRRVSGNAALWQTVVMPGLSSTTLFESSIVRTRDVQCFACKGRHAGPEEYDAYTHIAVPYR